MGGDGERLLAHGTAGQDRGAAADDGAPARVGAAADGPRVRVAVHHAHSL